MTRKIFLVTCMQNWLDFNTWATPRWKTALKRNAISMPMRLAIEKGIIAQSFTVLDFGCGHGSDVFLLNEHRNIRATGFDGFYAPHTPILAANVISLIYVLNVIESASERTEVMRFCWNLCNDFLLVAVRPESKSRNQIGEQRTSIGTFQKYFSQASLIEFVKSSIGECNVCPLGSGIIVIKR